MKVLIINKDLRLGGGTTSINNIVNGLRGFGIYIDVAIFENKIDSTSIDMHKIILLSKGKKIVKLLRPLYFLMFFLKLMFIVPNYDAVFTFERYPSYINVILSKLFNKKSIIYVINPLLESLSGIHKNKYLLKLHLFFHRAVFYLTDLVVVLENKAKRELIHYLLVDRAKVLEIPPFIDFEYIKSLSKDKLSLKMKQYFSKNKVVINIGRLHKQKNQELLIKSFYMVKKDIKNVILLIIGTGEEKNYLIKLINNLGLKDCVFIIENEGNPFKYLVRSDIFVLSSAYEGFPTVLIESLYFGLPIISTNCSSIVRNLIDSYGTVISNQNQGKAKLIANGIKYYLNKKVVNNIKIKGIKRTLEFSKEKILPLWAQVLRNLIIKKI